MTNDEILKDYETALGLIKINKPGYPKARLSTLVLMLIEEAMKDSPPKPEGV